MIFINYRREDSAATAGRLHDRLVQVFGRKDIFMDVDQIPPGIDFVAHLNSQVAACKVLLVVIGRQWLNVKNEAGERRLHQPDDFVAIEIAAALARDIRVIPLLVDGAVIPSASELPDSLKPLVRRQAIELRQAHFGRDAEALIERLREALGDKAGLGRWRARALAGAAAIAALLLIGVGGYVFVGHIVEQGVQRAELELDKQRKEAEAQANSMAMASQAEHERQAAQEAEQKRKADEAEKARQLAETKAAQSTDSGVRQPDASENPRGWVGLRFQQVTDAIAESLNIAPARGVLVAGVDDKGPAKLAGIEPADVVVSFDGHDIKELGDLPAAVADTPLGKVVDVVVIRKGKEETHKVTVGRLQGNEKATAKLPDANTPTTVASSPSTFSRRPNTWLAAIGGGSVFTTDSTSRCEQSCAEQQWCKAYSYNKRTGWCSLSKLAGDSMPSPDVDSGVRN
jgi:hypothetical protein